MWIIVGLIAWLLLALGSIIYFNYYFPQQGQRPWQKCLASIVRACGGGALAFGVTLPLGTRFRMPDNSEQFLYSPAAIITAGAIGFLGALLAACWPLFAKDRA